MKQTLLNSIESLPVTQLVKFVYWLEKEAETKLYEEKALKTLEDPQERKRIERKLKQRFCEHKRTKYCLRTGGSKCLDCGAL